jgi:hypothetical protein
MKAERDSGIDLNVFGFIAESVFAFIPDSCSRSPRNAVRNCPGIADYKLATVAAKVR